MDSGFIGPLSEIQQGVIEYFYQDNVTDLHERVKSLLSSILNLESAYNSAYFWSDNKVYFINEINKLVTGALEDRSLDSTIVDMNNTTSSSISSSTVNSTKVPEAYDAVRSDMVKINEEISTIKWDIPTHHIFPKASQVPHLNNAINDSYLLKQVSLIKAQYAAQFAKEVASAAK